MFVRNILSFLSNVISISYKGGEFMIGNVYNEELFFSESKFANLIFLPIQVNFQKIIAFFDTGASISFIKESVAKKLGLKLNKDIKKGGNNNGGEFEFSTCTVENINIGNINISNVIVGVIHDESLDFGTDDEGNTFPASFIFGYDLISELCWSFDMYNNKVTIQNGGTMPLSDSMHWNNFVIINTKYNSQTTPMGFDSGHTETLLDNTWLTRIKDYYKVSRAIVGIASQKDECVNIVENLSLVVSDIEIKFRDIEILEHSILVASENSLFGLLGADMISDKKWIIDAKSNYFKILQ